MFNDDSNKPKWRCICDCGNITVVTGINLRSGNTKSCGCLRTKFNDLTGQVFGKLTVVSRNHFDSTGNRRKRIFYNCVCECGNNTVSRSDALTEGKALSCGCNHVSKGVVKLKKLMDDAGIKYGSEICFDDLISPRGNHLRFDFAIYGDAGICRLIEFDGIQHYRAINGWWDGDDGLEYRQLCDKMKDDYAKNNNIPLVRIPYYHEDKLALSDLLNDEFLINTA